MSIFVVGVNHKTAPVSIREQIAFAPDRMAEALKAANTVVQESLILSTCNRTELYAANESDSNPQKLIEWLAAYHQIPTEKLLPYLFIHHQDQAVQHALRVACGLDSLVLGEPQILGQMKTALQDASTAGSTGNHLNKLMQHAFSTAKKVRTQTEIGANPVSVAFAAVSMAKRIFSKLEKQTAMLVGAGETIELVGRHLATNGIGNIIIANRNIERAQNLAAQYGGLGIGLPQLAEYLPKADIVISSTAAPLAIIGKGMTERALKIRKHRPIFMVDIAVPRDIEPEVSELDDVFLYTVDDLQSVIEENLESRKAAANRAEDMVKLEVEQFMGWLRSRTQQQVIRQLRQKNDLIRQDVLAKAQQLLQNKTPEEALHFLAHTLTNKLSHAPTKALNQAAHDGNIELIQQAITLFDLDDK